MRAEFMEEVQVKSAGYAAEYGGAMGGVINAVTRSGSNDWHGSVFVDYENIDWNGARGPSSSTRSLIRTSAELRTYQKDDETRWDPGFSLGGPILRDHLWFFASYQPGLRTTDRYVAWQSYPAQTYTSDFQVDYATLNLTANISSKLLLKVGGVISPYTTRRPAPQPGRSGRPAGREQLRAARLEGRA